MPRQSDATKAAIKHAVDIVGLVGEYLPLHRAGSRYKALCPFHDDHNPSLEVNPERQTFKCWVCGAGGDVLEFVLKIERIEFPEALRMLAERAGITLESGPASTVRPEGPSKTELTGVLAWAEGAFEEALGRHEPARGYIEGRGLTAETAARFRLGYAPDDPAWLFESARRRGVSTDLLEKAGLAVRPEEGPGKVHARFRGRLIFPIHDERGRPVGFGGRILPEAERAASSRGFRVAKYVNSPETALFQKRRILYAADLARTACREAGWVAVMEGYTDVMAAHQVGLANVVATLGTAFGDDHVPMLRRLADRACLIYDGDEAGQSAAERALEIFLGHELDVRVLSLPSGLDPCDFLLSEGADAFRKLAAEALDPLTFVLNRARSRFDLDSIEGARRGAEWVLGILCRVPSRPGTVQDLALNKALDSLAHALRLPIGPLARRLKELRGASRRRGAERAGLSPPSGANPVEAATAPPPPPPADLLRAMDPVERELVAIVVAQPETVARLVARVPLAAIRDDSARAILDAAYDLYGQGETPTFEAIKDNLDDPRPRSVVAYLSDLQDGLDRPELQPLDAVQFPPGTWGERLDPVLGRLAERERLTRLADLRQALDETDRATEPDAYRALQLEYRRLLTQRVGTPEKKTRPDPTFRA
ncbi:DNA primase [Planctomyces sp. SH-PL62]|uniref:DNA primase n=1 Tax=Planctomyces sp. SH-PL62 TaxID=1636152 RepID=UPI00078D302C|nr:DNA primase [Planctomyces sp. SH-PL62]AMV36038.1 DNA primase [Planctomyces sp. SH-PL62]